jgi:signal transduction histidine kinase
VLLLVRAQLPAVVEDSPAAPPPGLLSGHPALIVTEGIAALLLLVASVAFGLQATRQEDPLFRLLGPAFAFLAFARIDFLLFPSVYTQWVYSGDALRTACYGVLVYGAFREVQQFWSAQSEVAVLDDRRRLARELHDGVVQELAYIRLAASGLTDTQPIALQVVNAADRGLDEARAALQALGNASDEPLAHTLQRAAREVSARYGIGLEVELDDAVEVTQDERHALMRITREAISNAARHGQCTRVVLRLRADHRRRTLEVEDDGVGFDIEEVVPNANGYGLVSMRERAQALPGDLWLNSRPGSGTTVHVRW